MSQRHTLLVKKCRDQTCSLNNTAQPPSFTYKGAGGRTLPATLVSGIQMDEIRFGIITHTAIMVLQSKFT